MRPPPASVGTWLSALPHALSRALDSLFSAAKHAVTWVSHHTGLPVALVAAIALVVGWRLAKKTAHVVLEIAVALALVLAATRMGLIRW